MARIAQLADGTPLEFPDDTPDSVIQDTVKRLISEKSAKEATKAGESAAKDMSFGEKVAAGAGSGVENILHSIGLEKAATAVRGGGARDNIEEINKGLGGAGTLGRIGADVAITALPAAKVAQVAGKVAPWILKGTMAANAAKAGIEGAVAGGMTSEDNLKGAAGGAAAGAALSPVLTKVFSVLGKPVPQSAAAQAARREGVDLTAAQGADIATNRGKMWRGAEEAMASVPFLGRALRNARERGETSWRDRAINTILPGEVKATGQGGLTESAEARKIFTNLYEDALRGKKISIDEPFESFVIKAINDPTKFMSQAQRNYIEANVGKHIFSHARNPVPAVDETLTMAGEPLGAALPGRAAPAVGGPGPGTAVAAPRAEVGPAVVPPGPTLKDIVEPAIPPGRGDQMFHDAKTLFKGQSELRHLGRKMERGGGPSNKETAAVMNDIADEVYKMIARQDAPAGAVIERLRLPYTRLLAVEKAAKKAGGQGNFTPTQLRKAAEGLSDDLTAYARQGEEFMPKTSKDTYSTVMRAGRNLVPGLAILGGGFLHGPTAAGIAAATYGTGTKLGQKALKGDLALQKLLIERLRQDPTLGSTLSGLGGAKMTERKQ